MSDYTEHGAVPVEDAAVDDPPTVDELLAERRADDDHERDHDRDAADPDEEPADAHEGAAADESPPG